MNSNGDRFVKQLRTILLLLVLLVLCSCSAICLALAVLPTLPFVGELK